MQICSTLLLCCIFASAVISPKLFARPIMAVTNLVCGEMLSFPSGLKRWRKTLCRVVALFSTAHYDSPFSHLRVCVQLGREATLC